MVEVRITDDAWADMLSIGAFIAQRSAKYGTLQVERMLDMLEPLAQFPNSGRYVPEMRDKRFREVIIGNYRLIYFRVSATRIDVIAVHHSARRFSVTAVRRRTK